MLVVAIMAALAIDAAAPEETFPTSLHGARPGKAFWYDTDNGGFEKWTGISMAELGCAGCHGAVNADGEPYDEPYRPGCIDCHASADHSVSVDRCFSCHGRQAMEARRLALPDVHRDAGMMCWDCHGDADMHGDGTEHVSMLADGAIEADCGDCHDAADLPAGHDEHDPHNGALHCTACHSATVISCYNCHFESQVEARIKRAVRPLSGFTLLVNRDKDGKVHPASFQSLTFQGDAFVAFGPYTPHSTTRDGRRCAVCHLNVEGGANAAIEAYNDRGSIPFVTWNEETGSVDWMRGVIPLPEDYRTTLTMEFLTFDGDPAAPAGPDAGAWSPIGKDLPDGSQLLFATPLTREQMRELGFADPERQLRARRQAGGP
jgi:hypothetical protein